MEHAVAAEVRVAEALDAMAHAVRQRQQQAIVRHAVVAQRPAHAEVEAVADQHERDVVERVRVALAQLVGPDDQRIVEQRAGAARFRGIGQPTGQIGQLFADTIC